MPIIRMTTHEEDRDVHPQPQELNTDPTNTSDDTDETRKQQQSNADDDDDSSDKIPCFRHIHIMITTHFSRVFNWRLANLEPMPGETKVLINGNITNSILQSYLVWRHSMLYIAIPALFLNVILSASTIKDYIEIMKPVLNGLGDFLYFLPLTASPILLMAATATSCYWSAWRRSAHILRIGWIISFILPFVPAMVPISALLISCEEANNSLTSDDMTDAEYAAAVVGVRFAMAALFAIQLFPIVAMFPWSLSRAALKIRGLLPQSMLSCWILIIMAPFQSVVFLLGLIFLIQLGGLIEKPGGSVCLFIGTICFAAAPWVYVSRRHLFLCPPTEESEKQLDCTMVWIGRLVKLGVVFLLVGAIVVSGAEGAESVVQIVFEGIGHNLVLAVVFGDILFRMTVTNWQLEQDHHAHNNNNGDAIDKLLGEIQYSISKETSNEKRNEEKKAKNAELNTASSIEVNNSALSDDIKANNSTLSEP